MFTMKAYLRKKMSRTSIESIPIKNLIETISKQFFLHNTF